MKQYLIKWKRSDYITLGKAISNFNKKRNKLLNDVEEKFLPHSYNYQEEKNRIKTRKELNRFITELKKFVNENQEELIITQAGEMITKWEYNKLMKERKNYIKYYDEKIEKLEKQEQGQPFPSMERLTYINRRLNVQNFDILRGHNFQNVRERIEWAGSYDYAVRKGITYKENLLYALSTMEDFENYHILYDKIEKMNPQNVYDFISKSNVLKDIFKWYKNKVTYGDFNSKEEIFDYAIFEELELQKEGG